jgi:sensor histidine kinase YesM
MANIRTWLHHPLVRFAQHLAFWVLSFGVFLHLFKTGTKAGKIDYIYTALFHITIIPAVYINLKWLLPRLANYRQWPIYVISAIALILFFSWLNYSFFQKWSNYLLPDYFFISYFTLSEISLVFFIYLATASMLKLSKSWFAVNDLQRRLLEAEKGKIQIELRALKAQINPHFFFNTLNGIYAMSLDKDERLPETVLRLSHLMRYFLYELKEDLVPFEKEWQVLQDYIALQQIRSNQLLQIEKIVEGEIDQQRIAPLLLITFLENAFKHGAKGNTGPANIWLLLKIHGNDLTFQLKNSKGQVDDVEPTNYKGVGLENVQRRLQLLYAGRHRLDIQDTVDHFNITLQLQL